MLSAAFGCESCSLLTLEALAEIASDDPFPIAIHDGSSI